MFTYYPLLIWDENAEMREWGLPNHHDDMKHSSLMFIVRQVMQIQFTAWRPAMPALSCPVMPCPSLLGWALSSIFGGGLSAIACFNCCIKVVSRERSRASS